MKNKRRRTWNEEISLISVTNGEDEAGYPIDPVENKREVLANKLNVTRQEFYAASQSDMRADAIFEVHAFEYENEQYLEHDGKRYEVIRTFLTADDTIELTCSNKSVNHERS